MSVKPRIRAMVSGVAGPALVGRGVIVGANFLCMSGMALWLGLADFGRLAVQWGLVTVAASVIGAGAPLHLLQVLSDGSRPRRAVLGLQVLAYPAILAAGGFAVLAVTGPALPWAILFAAAFAVHIATAVASVMRACGQIHLSMAMRDGLPQWALAAAAVIAGPEPAAILALCAVILLAAAMTAGARCMTRPAWRAATGGGAGRAGVPLSLWGTSVLGTVLAQIDIIVGGMILSDGQSGLYALLRRLTNLVALPVSVATWVGSVPVAQSFGAGDSHGLRRASARASRIAFLPGGGLLVLALVVLACAAAMTAAGQRAELVLVSLILLGGAFLQVVFAAGLTVATLTGLAGYAALSRLCSIGGYLLLVGLLVQPTAAGNAAAMVLATALGSLLLWGLVRHKRGVDTSAFALFAGGAEVRWNRS